LGLTFDLRIVFGLALAEMKRAFVRKQISQKLSDQEQNDAKMDHPDADFFARPDEPREVCSAEIDQQYRANQITARKNRNFPRGASRSPINEKAPKKLVLRFEQTEFHLRKRAPEY